MAIAYVQSAKNFGTSSSQTCAFGSSVTAGSLLVVACNSYTSSTISSVTDSLGNTYARVGSALTGGIDPNNKLDTWCAKNVTGGACTVTVHSSGGTSLSIFLGEWSGVDTTAPLDQEAHAEPLGATTPSSGNTSTTAQADELLIGQLMGEWATDISITAGSGYSLRQSYTDGNAAIAGGLEDRIVSATGAYDATFSLGISANTLVRIATFLAGSSSVTLIPDSIDSLEAFGTPSVTPGAVTLGPASIATLEAFGTPAIAPGAVTFSPASIASVEAFGTPTVTLAPITITPSSITSAEAFGAPSFSVGAVTMTPVSITSAEALGTPTLSGGVPVVITPVALTLNARSGNVTLTARSTTLTEQTR